MALFRVRIRTGRFLSGAANWYSRTSPRAILAATPPPIPNLALPLRFALFGCSPGGRVLHGLAGSTGGDVPAVRLAPARNGFAWYAWLPCPRPVTASYPAQFERSAYVEPVTQYTPHGPFDADKPPMRKSKPSSARPTHQPRPSRRASEAGVPFPRFRNFGSANAGCANVRIICRMFILEASEMRSGEPATMQQKQKR